MIAVLAQQVPQLQTPEIQWSAIAPLLVLFGGSLLLLTMAALTTARPPKGSETVSGSGFLTSTHGSRLIMNALDPG